MKRRDFFTLVGGAAAWPLEAWAQPTQKQHRIAFVHSGIRADQLTVTDGPFWVRRFYETLRELGHIEGSNLVVERYSAEGRSDNFASLAATVVGRNPSDSPGERLLRKPMNGIEDCCARRHRKSRRHSQPCDEVAPSHGSPRLKGGIIFSIQQP